MFLTTAQKHGIERVKDVKAGLNPSSLDQLQFNGPYVGAVGKIGIGLALVGVMVGNPYYSNCCT